MINLIDEEIYNLKADIEHYLKTREFDVSSSERLKNRNRMSRLRELADIKNEILKEKMDNFKFVK